MKLLSVLIGLLFFLGANQAIANDDLSSAISKLQSGISDLLNGIDKDMQAAAKRTGKLGPDRQGKTRQILQGLYGNRPYVIDATFIDAQGVMKIIEPEQYKKHEGSDISNHESIIMMLKNKRPQMGSLFDSAEGIKSVAIEYPVFSGKGEFLGSISLLVKQNELIRSIAAPVEKELGVNCWVMQTDGMIIYETDLAQLGLNLFQDPLYRNYPELISLGTRMVEEKNGRGFYTFLVHGTDKVVTKGVFSRSSG